jgi:GDP-L-fucose synthase
MPTNLYGPGDNFQPEYAHVIPALLRRFHEATQTKANSVTIWGSGKPQREYLHVAGIAAASVHIMELDPQTYWSAVHP